jgi:hypothetical protein
VRFCEVDFNRLDDLERKRANRYGYRRVVHAESSFKRLARVVLDGETKYCVQHFVKATGSRGSHLVDIPVWSMDQTMETTIYEQTQLLTSKSINLHPLTRCNERAR